MNHIFTLRQILEQSKEWNAPLYANFVDMEKAFNSIHHDSLWRILRYNGVPQKLVNIMKMMYSNFSSQVICNNELTDTFEVITGVKQGCILSPFLFLPGIDWVIRSVINGKRRGIRWTLTSLLEDLDFADDIALLSYRRQDMQAKIYDMTRKAGETGLKISTKKTKHLRMNSRTEAAIMLNGEEIEDIGYKMTTSGDTEKEIRTRISKASQAFATLRSTWRSRNVSTKTKIRLFKSNVLSTLMYGAESWKMTKNHQSQTRSFPEQMPTQNPQHLLAKHHLER